MINTVLFDIDGVILSEERCFDASALAVWELLNSPLYLNIKANQFTPQPNEDMIQTVRNDVFNHNDVLSYIKSYGINSNWDIVYLTFSYQLIHLLSQIAPEYHENIASILKDPIDRQALVTISSYLSDETSISYNTFVSDFEQFVETKQDLFDHLNRLIKQKLNIDTSVFSRQNTLWNLGREVYQEWYVGDLFIEDSIGKKATQTDKVGFLQDEIPLASKEELLSIFNEIKSLGYVIGFSTGRPEIETHEPLKALELLSLVDEKRITTSTDVLNAEKTFPELTPLGKPHPYTYLSSYFSKRTPLEDVINTTLPLVMGEEILIIGDSIADGLAAQAMGATFVAILTGLTGEEARPEFEAMGADYILSHVRDVIPLLKVVGIGH